MEPEGPLPHSRKLAICVTSGFRHEADEICALVGSLPQPGPILSHSNPVHVSRSPFLKIHFNIVILSRRLPSSLFPPGLPTKTLYAPLLSRIRATCPYLCSPCLPPWREYGQLYHPKRNVTMADHSISQMTGLYAAVTMTARIKHSRHCEVLK